MRELLICEVLLEDYTCEEIAYSIKGGVLIIRRTL